ncbi:MAG: M23 family metallopeptidase [Bacillota bacterium]|nr:M23 family metallopeptidase [Bacillota bacterium]
MIALDNPRQPSAGHRWRVRAVTLGIALVVAAVWTVPGYIAVAYAVTVDGHPVGFVRSHEVVDQVLASLADQTAASAGVKVSVTSSVQVKRVRRPGGPLLEEEQLKGALQGRLSFAAEAWSVRVNGVSVVALPTEADARRVIEEIKAEYCRPGKGAVLVDVRFLQGVEVVPETVDIARLRTPEEAKRILMRGTDKLVTYTVKRGDSLWRIAQQHGLTVEDLRRANPAMAHTDILQVGQELSVVKAEPYVTVATVERLVQEVAIPCPVQVKFSQDRWPWEEVVEQAGKNGRKRITYEIVRQAGAQVERRVVEEVILEEPVTRVIVRGTRQVPALGTGKLYWPVEGGGRVTSGFGWRRRDWHPAIDIAAPAGTPVRAADTGMVTFAGWQGGYGRLIIVEHGNGMSTRYAHLSRVDVRPGDQVERGQVIGAVGSTGRATGPHLHFEVRAGGEARNPLQYYPSSAAR